MHIVAEPHHPPRISPSVATPWASHDQLELNLALFRTWDAILAIYGSPPYEMTFHMMLYVGNKNVAWPARDSSADDVYWHHCLARFDAFPGVVIDVSKEAGGYGVGNDYITRRLGLIHAMNPHQRPVTAHSGLSWSNKCQETSDQSNPCTFVSVQKHFPGDFYSQVSTSQALQTH